MRSLNAGRIVIAARALGIARAALEASVEYAKTRQQFGAPIAELPAIQQKLAQMAMRLYAARLAVFDAARRKDAGEDIALYAAMAKLNATEQANWICNEALQIHGAYGYTREFPVERFYRDVRLSTIVEGTSEIQHLIIARRILD
jgi:alkylation response protein AidB-like acyl-CoA dehydrogenase